MTKATSRVCVCIMEKTKRTGKDDGRREEELVPSFFPGKISINPRRGKSRLREDGKQGGGDREEMERHEMLFSFRGTKITKLFRGSAGIKLSRVVRTCESRGTNGARMFAREGLPGAILYRRDTG